MQSYPNLRHRYQFMQQQYQQGLNPLNENNENENETANDVENDENSGDDIKNRRQMSKNNKDIDGSLDIAKNQKTGL